MKLFPGRAPRALLLPFLCCTSQLASAFYLPGVAPTSYQPHDRVPLYVNSITPHDGEPIRAVVPYDYYHPVFQFCRPEGGPVSVSESLGSILFGDRIKTSPFELSMKDNQTCKPLCGVVSYSPKAVEALRKVVEEGYSLNWLVDGLPAGSEMKDNRTGTHYYTPGFQMGSIDGSFVLLNNHYDIYVEYHEVNNDPSHLRVVGATVHPSSIKSSGVIPDCETGGGTRKAIVLADVTHNIDVTFTYSVLWIKSDTAWVTRWDKYLHDFDPQIHWFWLVDIAVLVVVLLFAVTSILVRTLRKDIDRYNRLDQINLDDLSSTSALEDGIQEDSGWKLVHGDVFRPPSHTLLLSVLVGNGVQLFVMTALTVFFAMLGFLSPSSRGALGSMLILLYTFLGFFGGFVSARTYKAWQGEKWKLNIVLTPLVVPVIIFSTFSFLNVFLWANESSGAVPFTTMLVIIAMWFLVSVPLSFLGSYIGFKASIVAAPVRTNQIPRQIPKGPNYLRPIPSMLCVGLLPFLAIFMELLFVLRSIWFNRIYYMFGFLFLCYGLMIATCATVTILMVYLLLCAENYNWQWRSFLAAGTSGLYVFLDCLIYLFSRLHLAGFTNITLFLGYSALISFLFTILTGTIGYFASWWFVKKIYGSLKVD